MSKQEQGKLVQQFLDGDLDPSREKEVLRMMAEDSELRELLHFEIYLNRVFKNREGEEQQSFTVPEGFSDQVMEAIEQREQEEPATVEETPAGGFLDWIKNGVDVLLQPQTVQWRPAYGMAAVVAVLAVVIALNVGDQPRQPTQPTAQNMQQSQVDEQADDPKAVKVASTTTEQSNHVWARFFYVNDQAESVAVAGDFSDWEPIPLDQKTVNGNTVWTNTIQMEKGEHRYMYIVNGDQWTTDPLATRYKEDGFGHRNAVISL